EGGIQQRRITGADGAKEVDRVIVNLNAGPSLDLDTKYSKYGREGKATAHVVVNVTNEVILHQNVIASGQIDASSTVGAGVDLFDVADFILLDRAPVDDERGLNTGHLSGAASCRDNAVNGIATDQETLAIRDQHTTEDILISRHGRTEDITGNDPSRIDPCRSTAQIARVLDPEDVIVLNGDVRSEERRVGKECRS